MPASNSIFFESIIIFKRILKYIIEKKYEEKKFEIVGYCLKKDIDLNKEIDFLNFITENLASVVKL